MTARLRPNRLFPSGPVAMAGAVATVAIAAVLAGCGSVQAPDGASAANTLSPGSAAASSTSPSGATLTSPGLGSASPGSASPGGVNDTASPGGTASPSAPGSGSGSGSAGTACLATGLRVRLDTAAAGVAAGTYYVPLEFTNTSRQSCQMTGYPGVAFTSGAAGQQIGAQAAVDRAVRTTAVVLAPGATAHAWLQVLDAANFPASKCHPVTAAGLRVVVPGSVSASYLAHQVAACKSAIHGSQLLVVHPVQPGRAQRGTA